MINKNIIVAVGFDLDGTLYPSTPDVDGRVRTEIAKRILEKKPELESIKKAREYFEQRYAVLGSGKKVIQEAGHQNFEIVMDECLARADVLDLIDQNPELAEMLERMSKTHSLFLITSSPEEIGIQKLGRIGIPPEVFKYRVYRDTPDAGLKNDSQAFSYFLRQSGLPPSHHVYVGDRLKGDILPAKAIGMQTIAVGSEIQEADLSIKNIKELEQILQ